MVVVALVLSLLALPAFGVREEGLEGMSFSSQPLNLLDHHQAGLIEVKAGTGGKETENEDECDKQLRSLEKTFAKTCERHGFHQRLCRTRAKETIQHSKNHHWQKHLVGKVLDDGKTPVFWAGFWPGGKEGIDTREALADFISSVNGFQLANTEWGQAAESEGANNLEACSWDRKKNWWNAASISMAKAMALHKVKNITIALHKPLHGNFSFYNTVLYQAELPSMGYEMWKSKWNPQFEVHSIAVEGAPPDESGCALASVVESQLELYAKRPVTVWCRPCTTLQSCGEKYQGEWKNGLKDGQGTKVWADGSKYQGQWKNGTKDGQGTETLANGDKYQGGWKMDKKDGNGTATFTDGSKYQGQWKNGTKDGQGTMTYANGDKYQGGWKMDKKDGKGTYTFASRNIWQGQGIYTSTPEDKYKVWYEKGHLTKKVKKK